MKKTKPSSEEEQGISRREFLKIAATGAAGIALMTTFKDFFKPMQSVMALQTKTYTDLSSPSITRYLDKCIGCQYCLYVCESIQQIGIYQYYDQDGRQYVDTKGEVPLSQTPCINCGQCVKVCPVGALVETDGLAAALAALEDASKNIVWQIAPSVQNMLGEEFGVASGVDVSKKIATAMKLLGGHAFHTDFGADVTIMEEGSEFVERLQNGGTFPMITSCCPGWIKYMELHYPDLFSHLSSCKSPQQMFGSLVKSYYPIQYNVDAESVYHISVMPCTAKKFECSRSEMESEDGLRDVDLVLTSREFAKLLRLKGISLTSLEDSEFDNLMGESSGAARIFGASGGVMEASLRAVYQLLTNKPFPYSTLEPLRTQDGIKTMSIDISGKTFNFAAVNGIGNINNVMEQIKDGTCPYHFIEVMACPNGCIGGGGAPLVNEDMSMRQQGIYKSDTVLQHTVCSDNSEIKKLYQNFLERPCSHRAKKLLHTTYTDRSNDF